MGDVREGLLVVSEECKLVSVSVKRGFGSSFQSVCPDSAAVCIDLMAGRGEGGECVYSVNKAK